MTANEQNSKTLAAYEAHVPEYLASGSPLLGHAVTQWLHTAVAPRARARIFEIGSGPGTIAEYLIGNGHLVDVSDAAMAFVQHLRVQGHDARLFNVWAPRCDVFRQR